MNAQALKHLEIPGRVAFAAGNGGLAKIIVTTRAAMAEIYLHGAHVTHFQKNGEAPLLFLSARSGFGPGQPIRGGVPICFPWFGHREGGPSHGLARIAEWQLVKTSVTDHGTVTLRFAMPRITGDPAWNSLRTEFVVTVADTLTMELTTANESGDGAAEIENCLHTYFLVGDIRQVSLAGLAGAPFDDFAAGAAGARRVENDPRLRITQETNRVYPDSTGVVEIHDEHLRRNIRVEKHNSRSTVVWNPWTTQKLPDDFDPAEHQHMVCVESGNVKQNKISLAPGGATSLKVVIRSQPQ